MESSENEAEYEAEYEDDDVMKPSGIIVLLQ